MRERKACTDSLKNFVFIHLKIQHYMLQTPSRSQQQPPKSFFYKPFAIVLVKFLKLYIRICTQSLLSPIYTNIEHKLVLV